ncbi:hypothetical protein ACG98H_04665 [Corynebacterium sp. L4756]|uniref:hypothetical protein n=1 Tax=unclassified Corynebacterium TaxID=2624378 RepID=UPI00374DAC14
MADKAGIFNTSIDLSGEVWRWKDGVLRDSSDQVLASVRADVISVARQNLLIEHNIGAPRFRLRATSSKGNLYTMGQASFTVNILSADCDHKRYKLQRTNPFRKERVISNDMGQVLRTRPRGDGTLTVTSASAQAEEVPFFDAVFLSYGCVLIDGQGVRDNTRI